MLSSGDRKQDFGRSLLAPAFRDSLYSCRQSDEWYSLNENETFREDVDTRFLSLRDPQRGLPSSPSPSACLIVFLADERFLVSICIPSGTGGSSPISNHFRACFSSEAASPLACRCQMATNVLLAWRSRGPGRASPFGSSGTAELHTDPAWQVFTSSSSSTRTQSLPLNALGSCEVFTRHTDTLT